MARPRVWAAAAVLTALFAATMVSTPTSAEATVVPAPDPGATDRFDAIIQGGIVVTGNSIGLAKQAANNGPGTKSSIGTFMAAGSSSTDSDPANPTNPWPVGTTNDWHADASQAQLTLPAGATVQYAELVWGGSYNYGGETPSTDLDASVTLSSGGQSTAVAPDPATATTLAKTGHQGAGTFAANYYERSADVTAWVATHGSAAYTVGGLPATEATSIDSLNAGGWTLAVVYGDPSAPVRWVGLNVGTDLVDDTAAKDVGFSGFCSPTGGAHASLVAAAMAGDADLTGDQLLTAPSSAGPFANLAGINNLQNNFFASQINGSTGALDTSGTFGTVNHTPSTGTNANVSGARQGWDVTTVPLPDTQLAAGQSALDVRAITTGDAYLPMLVGLQTQVAAPAFADTSSVSPTSVVTGASSTLTVPIANTGQRDADATSFKLALPAGLGLAEVTVDGVATSATAASLATGLDLGTVALGATRTVRVRVTGQAAGSYVLAPSVGYTFDRCSGFAPVTLSTAFGPHPVAVATPTTPPAAPDVTPPDTSITGHPKAKSTRRKVVFQFSASETGSTFTCSLDDKTFSPCVSGQRVKVKLGRHSFEVRATDPAGNVDPSPAAYRFKVVKKPTHRH